MLLFGNKQFICTNIDNYILDLSFIFNKVQLIFYIFSWIPKTLFIGLVDIYIYSGLFRFSKSYKISIVNLQIAYPDINNNNMQLLVRMSVRESLISVYETIYTWGNSEFVSNKLIFKIENNFLIKNNFKKEQGLICVAIHNRSVDMLLTWINSQVPTVSLYKKIKNKTLDAFVKNKREINNSTSVETSISGVRKIYKALKQKKVICFAADQVPKRGMGEHIDFYKRKAYSTTLVQNLATKTKSPTIYFCMNSNINNFLYISIKHCNDDIYDDSKHLPLVNSDIEKMINKRPIDYSWEYKRFKRSLPINQNPYLGI